jgi:hypothetical protein
MARTQVLGTDGDDILNEGPRAASDIFGFAGVDQIFLNRSDDLGGDISSTPARGTTKSSTGSRGATRSCSEPATTRM